jgi:REP element-mobilizing transposase RayT
MSGMSRPLRILAEDALYHVMSRGNAKMDFYRDDVDRWRFLAALESVVEQYRLECHAYCLMSNHYHLMLRTLDANLSQAIHQLNGVYAQWWNRRHQRVGHVMQGRFKAQLVQRDGYFLEACRYVVLNPVRGGLAQSAADWPWSSYAATAGLAPRPALLTVSLVLGGRGGTARYRAYQSFVAAAPDATAVGTAIRDDVRIIGSEAFAEKYRVCIEEAHPREVPLRERRLARKPLADLFRGVTDKRLRDRRIREARLRNHYSLSEIAAHLGLHYASVSRIASRRPVEATASEAAVPSVSITSDPGYSL